MKTYYSNINNFKDSTQEMEGSSFEDRYASYLELISNSKKERILSFKKEDDRLRSLAGIILLTDIIKNIQKEYINTPLYKKASDIAFPLNIEYEEFGKPYIVGFSELVFSISHSGLYAAVAIADTSECCKIGVDIQAKDRTNISKIATRFYTDIEKNIIDGANESSKKEDYFYKIWSAKEAFMKCDGKGLSYGLTNFNADITNNIVTDQSGKCLATLKEQECPEGYACYVCTIND